jgi:uncharacterized membrane protein
MNVDPGRTVLVGFVIFFLLCSATITVAEEEFQFGSTNLQVYRDGLVRVTQTLTVNEIVPEITLSLLDTSCDNFIVLDENQTVLDYEVKEKNLSIYTLGTKSVSLQYDTQSLTSKDAEVWTLLADIQNNLTVQLPEDSTIVFLSELPAAILTEANQIILSLFPNQWEISYIFPLIPSPNFQISNLEITPTEAEIGEEITISVRIINVSEQTGSYTLQLLLDQTIEETKTVTLEKGSTTTIKFKIIRQKPGTYIIEIGDLVGQVIVSEASSNGLNADQIPIEYIIAVLAVMAVIFFSAAFFLIRRRGYNIEKITKMHSRLNKEEKDVIQFLADNKGKAFESQIRNRFPEIPRTSLWRLVKRLEKLEIITVKKIGLENQVQLKNK